MAEFIFGALTMFTILFITGLCMQPRHEEEDPSASLGRRIRESAAKRRVK